MRDPWIWDRITDDRCPAPDQFAFPPGVTHIGGFVGPDLAAVMSYHAAPEGTRIHYSAARRHRPEALRLCLACLEHVRRFGRVFCEIPEMYRSVINFARHCGFSEVARHANSHTKHGATCDTIIMVKEWES